MASGGNRLFYVQRLHEDRESPRLACRRMFNQHASLQRLGTSLRLALHHSYPPRGSSARSSLSHDSLRTTLGATDVTIYSSTIAQPLLCFKHVVLECRGRVAARDPGADAANGQGLQERDEGLLSHLRARDRHFQLSGVSGVWVTRVRQLARVVVVCAR